MSSAQNLLATGVALLKLSTTEPWHHSQTSEPMLSNTEARSFCDEAEFWGLSLLKDIEEAEYLGCVESSRGISCGIRLYNWNGADGCDNKQSQQLYNINVESTSRCED